MKGVTAQSCQVYKVGGEVERNMYGVSGKFKSSFNKEGGEGGGKGGGIPPLKSSAVTSEIKPRR